jgi:predicted transcriptional regulator
MKTAIPPGQLKLLGIILKLRQENKPITLRGLAKILGCYHGNVQYQLKSMMKKWLVDWEKYSNNHRVKATIHPLVKFIHAKDL